VDVDATDNALPIVSFPVVIFNAVPLVVKLPFMVTKFPVVQFAFPATTPSTSNKAPGAIVFIPIFPALDIRILSKLSDAITKSFESNVPRKLLFAVTPIADVLAVVPELPVNDQPLLTVVQSEPFQ